LIFKRLGELNAVFKVLVTGTPLNNTVREILNLLNFLDPEEWNDLDALELKYENPNEELYKELRQRIMPYMLRRRKDDVLKLEPKVWSPLATAQIRH
jgi:SNF2 family DNA or RNA helicase